MMKVFYALIAAAALGLTASGWANEADAKNAGCTGKCHDMNKEKGAPSYKDVSKKFKGKGEAAILAAYKANKEHADNKATEDQVKKVTGWLLTLP